MAVVKGNNGVLCFCNENLNFTYVMDIGGFSVVFGNKCIQSKPDPYREASTRKKERAWKIKDALHQFKEENK